jgi:hypothetical protein
LDTPQQAAGSFIFVPLLLKGLTHMAFVISGVLLALMDYVTERAKRIDKA